MKLLLCAIIYCVVNTIYMFTTQHKDNCRSVIATKNISKGTILFDEEIKCMIDKKKENWYQLLIEFELKNHFDIFLDLVPYENDKNCINDAVFDKLSDFQKLLNNESVKSNLQLMYNKIIRNAFNVKINNKQYATVLYKGRLFNHSCCPNVLFKLVQNKNKHYMRFYTCRDIMKGEELTDNYFDVNFSYVKRQYIAKTFYGFVCKCDKCKKQL